MNRRNGGDPIGSDRPRIEGRRDNGAGPPPAGPLPAGPPPAGPPSVDEPLPVLYIAGIGRSGSTLLNRTLGATPGFFAGGELMHFFGRGVSENELCSCGTPFRECDLWSRVIAELGKTATPESAEEIDPFRHELTEGRHLLTMLLSPWKPPSLRGPLQAYRRTVVEIYRAVQRVTGCRVLVDSSKNLSYARILQGIPELRIFIVHLVRDPRGVTYSMSKTIRRPGVPWNEEYLSRRGALPGALLWLLANSAAEWLRSRSGGYIRIRYTDFVGSPADTLRRVLRLIGEGEDPSRLAHLDGRSLTLGVQHILSGNPVRGRIGEIPLEEDLEWRERMEPRRRRLVTALTLPFLQRYGYLAPDGASPDGISPDGIPSGGVAGEDGRPALAPPALRRPAVTDPAAARAAVTAPELRLGTPPDGAG